MRLAAQTRERTVCVVGIHFVQLPRYVIRWILLLYLWPSMNFSIKHIFIPIKERSVENSTIPICPSLQKNGRVQKIIFNASVIYRIFFPLLFFWLTDFGIQIPTISQSVPCRAPSTKNRTEKVRTYTVPAIKRRTLRQQQR